MREELLQFIWRFCYFKQSHLFTEAGEAIEILSPGELNTDQRPDFRNARIRIGGILREGPVELHIAASDWARHGHDGDLHYQGVILHVVWEDDGGPPDIPVLVLQHRVSKLLLGLYEKWMNSQLFIPCERQLIQVEASVWKGWKEQLLLARLYQRAAVIRGWLEQNQQHWEETMWWLMARSLGLPVNGDAFEALARSIPLRLLARHRQEPVRMEALLLGQAGMLEEGAGRLQKEYQFLKTRHKLKAIAEPVLFSRMRPAHFPGRRLVQLARLFSDGESWFARIKEADSPRVLEEALRIKGLGATMKRGIMINAFVPMLFTYGWLRDEPDYREKALSWLREGETERNSIISNWQRLGVSAETAADSQALLELKKNYCKTRKCLDCAIGQTLLGLPSS